MPQLTIKGEGKGNGVKTVLPNISDIAKSLSRPASCEFPLRRPLPRASHLTAPFFNPHLPDPTKFFGCELGAQTMWDEKADRYIVNGTHSADRLRELLDGFIAKFVLCASCKNPETDLIITKDETVLRDCKACGVRKPVDMGHKLVAFILKNPPKKPSKKSKKEGNGDEAPTGEDDGDDEMTRKIKAGAADMSKVKTVDADEVDWSADTSKEAQAARMEKLNSGLQATLINGEQGDDEDAGPYGDLKKWLIDNRASATDAEIYKKAADLGIEKKHRTVQTVVEGLFTEDVLKEIESHTPLLLKVSAALLKLRWLLLLKICAHLAYSSWRQGRESSEELAWWC